jgi:hypothetical protein
VTEAGKVSLKVALFGDENAGQEWVPSRYIYIGADFSLCTDRLNFLHFRVLRQAYTFLLMLTGIVREILGDQGRQIRNP